ncbi:thioredoxin domain-containing protein [Candidatus Peregrinibacteria bacterium]|nr:thioredoxin domain-containing protein [Candidatus Peregrinibacteria bacterium]
MKTFYSSAFVSLILAFFLFLSAKSEPIIIRQGENHPPFSTILAPAEGEEIFENTFLSKPLEIELYDDFYCDACDHFALNALRQLKADTMDIGKGNLRVFFGPPETDEKRMTAVMAVKCAGDQGKFWELYEKIHEEKPEGRKTIDPLAKSLKIDMAKYAQCMESERYREEIGIEREQAAEKKAFHRPTLLINGYRLIGDQPIENIKKVIDEATRKPPNL